MTDSRKPDAGCQCMAYQDQLPLYARSARVPDERFIPWRFCPWCGRDSRSPIPAQPSPEQREGADSALLAALDFAIHDLEYTIHDGEATDLWRQQATGHIETIKALRSRLSVVSPPADEEGEAQ